ncbi:flagellar motor switch protein FliN [Salinisphaera sp. SPP-AMP-43]|uniref:flagellar motor switch protein FliN n=1 Tax=Salinisphaera sp. SPP-AMP-43 TaxID=3121288 RepID=UPI003C6E1302
MTDSPKDTENEGNEGAMDDIWAEAMAEQAQSEQAADPGAEDNDAGADMSSAWAEAMAEQQATEAEPEPAAAPHAAAASARSAEDSVFKPLTGESTGGARRDLDMIMEIPVTLSVELGSTRLSIRELLDLAQGSIVELDGLAGEPMDILINGYLVAQGEVVVVEDKYGIRITDIVTKAERIQKLNR